MTRALKVSVSSAFTLASAAVIFACSSGATEDTGTDSPTDLTRHPTVMADCHTPQPDARHPAVCFAERRTDVAPFVAKPAAVPSGYGPADLAAAYNIPSNLAPNSIVAIVDAQDDPNAESDLAVYRAQYGLPACTTANGCFKKVNQKGATSPLPKADSGWAGEISLDLDMVSAVCPSCKILLVEVDSADMTNLGTGVNTAVALGAVAVSNSYGGGEDSSVVAADAAYFNHPGVFITASAGDNDFGASFPATSAHVTAVGGTSLVKSSNARGWSETVWHTSSSEGTGSGCSAYISKPSFQKDTGCKNRVEADVSAVADPNTGVAIYDTYGGASAGATGWAVYGGTSASSPIIAALFTRLGKATTATNGFSYANTADFYDVTSGNNGTCGTSVKYECTAGVGYDGPTGNGTPNAAAIAGAVTPPPPVDAGAPVDSGVDSGSDSGTSSGGTCKHSVCTQGARLTNGCNTCASAVCAADSYCCHNQWDNICVSEVAEYCPSTSCN